MKRINKYESDAFIAGVACGLASLNRLFDAPTSVNGTLEGLGLDLSDLKAAGTDDYDLDEIRKCMDQGNKRQREQTRQSR